MIEFKVDDIMYVKTECLDDHLPSGFSQYYKGTFYDPCTDKTYPSNACRVREWKISTGPGAEDPVSVKVEMLYDNQVWEFPSRMLYQKPEIKTSIPFDCCGFVSTAYKNFVPDIGLCSNYMTKKYDRQEEGVVNSFYIPKRIIYNNPATIVFWKDGTKTVVKKAAKEPYNKYNAFCAALAKKVYGNNSRVNTLVSSGEDQVKKKKDCPFVRDEKGRWVSKKVKKKDGKKK